MASTSADWLLHWLRRPYLTLTQFAFLCCGWDPARSGWIPPDIQLYDYVREIIRMAVDVYTIPIIEKRRYELEPAGHTLTQADDDDADPWRYLDSDAAGAARQERAGAPEPLFRLTDALPSPGRHKFLWQWAIDQFPDTVAFTAADFPDESSARATASASDAISTAPTPAASETKTPELADLRVPLSVAEFAERLGISEDKVRRMIKAKDVLAHRIGRKTLRIPQAELDRIVATNKYLR